MKYFPDPLNDSVLFYIKKVENTGEEEIKGKKKFVVLIARD